eukprot:CAMPEP_0172317966 /NCGR_PEP_ID=MMETSP1058-20130122/33441_1 /TAXON_ID=83371 /ORGANISM="Detonula confervacea, Strain CCMP 353" /LENGTH=393 /DNA_ID=CAMNT_0013032665 /DNA_START=340 /DNA_END=1521 /DNA_ORIENTATION=+
MTKNFFKSNYESEIVSHLIPRPENKTVTTNGTELLFYDTMKTDYSCFPPRRHTQMQQQNNENPTIIYLETAYVNLHYETYYSFIDRICSCDSEKDVWTINTNRLPHFYIGPEEYLTSGFESVLQEYNTTTCGPIFFGTPKDPQLTVVTTSYPSDFEPSSKRQYHKKINDPRYIFICHEDAPSLEENASNVFFLTPRHNRYIIPSFFPPALVQKHSKSTHERHPKKPPIFLVLGSFNNRYRRNVESLMYPLMHYRDKNFTVRFLGGSAENVSNDKLTQKLHAQFPEDYHKIEFLPRTDTDEFMVRVAESDVILPLVDVGNFNHYKNGYQGGKKLTSSVMWGLGFHKKMILYRPLAEVFGIQEDNTTYFLHGDSTAHIAAFFEAFGRCLDHVLGN